jgi:hypothetical protein
MLTIPGGTKNSLFGNRYPDNSEKWQKQLDPGTYGRGMDQITVNDSVHICDDSKWQ